MEPTNLAAVCAQYTPADLAKRFQGLDNAHAIARANFAKSTHGLVNVPSNDQADAYLKQMSDMLQIGQAADSLFAFTQICQRAKEGLQLPTLQGPSLRAPLQLLRAPDAK